MRQNFYQNFYFHLLPEISSQVWKFVYSQINIVLTHSFTREIFRPTFEFIWITLYTARARAILGNKIDIRHPHEHDPLCYGQFGRTFVYRGH